MVGYREGGMNTHTHKLVGQSDFGPITFSRGVIAEQSHLWKWSEFLHSWNTATVGGSDSNITGGNDYRCNIMVKVFDHPHSVGTYQESGTTSSAANNLGKVRLGIKMFDCWPGAYTLSDLSAGDSGIIVQQLTVHHEGFKLAWNATDISNLEALN
jgi:phage tail-like protein